MIPVRVFRIGICPEAFSFLIVIMIYFISQPGILTFNAKMIIGAFHKIAAACLGFQYALGQGNGCRYARTLHFLYRNKLVRINVPDNNRVLGGCMPPKDESAERCNT
jgi:hypothetical protein